MRASDRKQEIRERIWDELEDRGVARFPFPPHGRIPNFEGSDEAAIRLTETHEWEEADAIKSNPDSPQKPVRRRALEEGRSVYMAVPRLRDEKCFLRLNPDEIDDYSRASTIKGSSELGVQVDPESVDDIDVIVSGSVAVNNEGERIGKGEGYSDLEYGVLSEVGAVDNETTVVTTVHEIQVIEDEIGVSEHDVPLDFVVTPERTIETDTRIDRPRGVNCEELSPERVEEIPILQRFCE